MTSSEIMLSVTATVESAVLDCMRTANILGGVISIVAVEASVVVSTWSPVFPAMSANTIEISTGPSLSLPSTICVAVHAIALVQMTCAVS